MPCPSIFRPFPPFFSHTRKACLNQDAHSRVELLEPASTFPPFRNRRPVTAVVAPPCLTPPEASALLVECGRLFVHNRSQSGTRCECLTTYPTCGLPGFAWYLMMRLLSLETVSVEQPYFPTWDLVPRWRDRNSLGIGCCPF